MDQELGWESYTQLKEAHNELMEDNRWVKDENPMFRKENEHLVEEKR